MSSIQTAPIVAKIGGALLEQPDAVQTFWSQVASLRRLAPVIVVHGGGAQATNLARRLGHEPRMIHGRRITTDVDLEVVKAAFGIANIDLVASGFAAGISTIGITGVDGRSLLVEKRPPRNVDGEIIDFGWVGDVVAFHPELINDLLSRGRVPVVAPLGVDDEGKTYNVNADTVAAEIARAVGASMLLLVTESGGVRRTVDDPQSILPECSEMVFQNGVSEGWISAGMRTKIEVAMAASNRSSAEVFVVGYDDLVERIRSTRIVAANTSNRTETTQATETT